MSRELQRYSIANQRAAIAAYAEVNGLAIVRTHEDKSRSGLRIKGPGLIALIEYVQSGHADFDQILVYDVSRWGRFHDTDESAYYEFLCKMNGVHVVYCAEMFKNDGTFLSGMAKYMKRGMAAEGSQELGVEVHTGHCRVSSLGYRVGAPVGYGLRRMTVDENEHRKRSSKRASIRPYNQIAFAGSMTGELLGHPLRNDLTGFATRERHLSQPMPLSDDQLPGQ